MLLALFLPFQPFDITYIRLARDFVYLAVIMDVHTRAVCGWHLSRSLDRELTLTALRRALADRVPQIHHSDQGVQYACGDYTDLLRAHGVQISMAAGWAISPRLNTRRAGWLASQNPC